MAERKAGLRGDCWRDGRRRGCCPCSRHSGSRRLWRPRRQAIWRRRDHGGDDCVAAFEPHGARSSRACGDQRAVLPGRGDDQDLGKAHKTIRGLAAAEKRMERQIPGRRQRRLRRFADPVADDLGAQAGYAVSATDTGHTGGTLDAAWALGHPERSSTSAGARSTRRRKRPRRSSPTITGSRPRTPISAAARTAAAKR